MGRRREQRLVITFPVRVSGTDLNGNPFVQDCETVDLSRNGCRLRWLACLRGPGEVVEVQYVKEKARFKVCWIGEEGSRREGHVGLRVLDDKYIWGVALARPKPDDYVLPEARVVASLPAAVEPVPIEFKPGWEGQERRQHRRYRCPGEVEAVDPATGAKARGLLGDISLGGCYIDVMAPLPVDTSARLVITAGGTSIETSAVVRSSHPSMGMGMEFTEMTPENRARLEALTGQLAHQFEQEVSEVAPSAGVEIDRYSLSEADLVARPVEAAAAPPTAPPTVALGGDAQAVLDTLLELLYSKGVLTQEELQQLLEKARAAAASERG